MASARAFQSMTTSAWVWAARNSQAVAASLPRIGFMDDFIEPPLNYGAVNANRRAQVTKHPRKFAETSRCPAPRELCLRHALDSAACAVLPGGRPQPAGSGRSGNASRNQGL